MTQGRNKSTETDNVFSRLSDDVVLSIFSKLEDDPRNWARLACVCTKFSSLICTVCWRHKCASTIPAVVSDLLSSSAAGSSSPPGGWAALYKLAVCCPGLLHSGVLLDNSDFGLEREIGPDENYRNACLIPSSNIQPPSTEPCASSIDDANSGSASSWSLFDDLSCDTIYDVSESQGASLVISGEEVVVDTGVGVDVEVVKVEQELSVSRSGRICWSMRSHLASGVWNLSREQGSKLLARQFRDDCLYICDWPGCVHIEEKRKYMLFRGIFKNFKRSRVWRTINDGNRSKIDVNCAFCACKATWDLHSAFCLRRVFGYHDDGEPVVRAFVCENGHVSGAWTDLPLYT